MIERELRADIRYLLSKFYLYYALLPMREGLRDQLTKRAVLMTTGVVVLIGIAIAINIGGSKIIPGLDEYSAVLITVLTRHDGGNRGWLRKHVAADSIYARLTETRSLI